VSDVHKSTLRGWLTCRFELLYDTAFKDDFLEYGKKTKATLKCLNTADIKMCAKELEERCKSSRLKIIKTIRTPLQLALSVMHDIPGMRIIHLVRDPRSTMKSQTHRGVCPIRSGGIPGCAKRHCANVWDNTQTQNKSNYRDRILTIKYEDIAMNPIETAQKMYDFVDLEFNESVKKYVYEVTLGGDRTECKVCQLKWQIGGKHDSSMDHIDAWKKTQAPGWIAGIQNACTDVLDFYNYTMV